MRRFIAGITLALAFCWPCLASAQSLAGLGPCAGGTLAVTGTSSNVQLSNCGPVVILYNISSQEAFYDVGTSSSLSIASAPSTSTSAPSTSAPYSLPGNSFVTLNLGGMGDAGFYLAGITATSTATIRIVQGYALP